MTSDDVFDFEAEQYRRAQIAHDYALACNRAERRANLAQLVYLLCGVGALLAIAAVCVWGER